MRFPSKFILLIIIFSFVISNIAYAFTNNSSVYEYDAGAVHGFMKHLVSKGEYYRAYMELQRLKSYYPAYLGQDRVFVTEFYLLFMGKRYPEVLNNKRQSAGQDINAINILFKADCLFENSDFLNAANLLNTPGIYGINKHINLYLYKRTVLSFLMLNKIDEARRIINNQTYIDNEYSGLSDGRYVELIDYTENTYDSLKSPYCALAAGIIPGMGYAYSGQRATGIIAFILISALSAVTYYSFTTDNEPLGIFFGAAATFFYGGSILGGYMAAGKYNNAGLTELKDALSGKLDLAGDRENIYMKYGAGSNDN